MVNCARPSVGKCMSRLKAIWWTGKLPVDPMLIFAKLCVLFVRGLLQNLCILIVKRKEHAEFQVRTSPVARNDSSSPCPKVQRKSADTGVKSAFGLAFLCAIVEGSFGHLWCFYFTGNNCNMKTMLNASRTKRLLLRISSVDNVV